MEKEQLRMNTESDFDYLLDVSVLKLTKRTRKNVSDRRETMHRIRMYRRFQTTVFNPK